MVTNNARILNVYILDSFHDSLTNILNIKKRKLNWKILSFEYICVYKTFSKIIQQMASVFLMTRPQGNLNEHELVSCVV